VEIEELKLGGPVLWVLLRTHYASTNEVVEGRWLIPVVDGLVSITVLARDQTTGYRESALWLTRDPQGVTDPREHPGQAFFDDPAHDAAYPTHPLSRVRAARACLEDPARGALQVRSGSSTTEAPSIESAVVPPRRGTRPSSGKTSQSSAPRSGDSRRPIAPGGALDAEGAAVLSELARDSHGKTNSIVTPAGARRASPSHKALVSSAVVSS